MSNRSKVLKRKRQSEKEREREREKERESSFAAVKTPIYSPLIKTKLYKTHNACKKTLHQIVGD